MRQVIVNLSNQRRQAVFASLVIAMLLVTAVVGTIIASPSAADLESSKKEVNAAQTAPGSSLQYTILLDNSGDQPINTVVMTDVLPSAVNYVSGTLNAEYDQAFPEPLTSLTYTNGIVSWQGSIGQQGAVTITFQAALTDTLIAGDQVTNTVAITGTGYLITRTAVTAIITTTNVFLPIIYKPVPAPFLNVVVRTTSDNQWDVSWLSPDSAVTKYELEEAQDMSFSNPTRYDMGVGLEKSFSPSATTNNLYCYRARAFIGALVGNWSNVRCVYGNYRDDFNTDTGWGIRRQDTDDVNNSSYLQNGNFVVKIGGRWDYAIASPLRQAPWQNYRIETSVKLEGGIDNLHSYGLIFGGDWDGNTCPTADYSTCFNQYYRLNVIWTGSPDKMKFNLKRIDYHDPANNSGRGVDLTLFSDVLLGDTSGWNTWAIEVYADGTIKVFANGTLVATAQDATYGSNPYFGVFASDDEYLGSEPWFDYYEVKPLP